MSVVPVSIATELPTTPVTFVPFTLTASMAMSQ
jgi:hypothetical protein